MVTPLRGQVACIDASSDSENMRAVVCGEGYAIPAFDGCHIIGSTYERCRNDIEPDRVRSEMLRSRTIEQLPNVFSQRQKIQYERASLRASTPARLPLVGEVPERDGLFLAVGFGSRGVISTPLAAEIIKSAIFSEPAPVEEELTDLVKPERRL